MPKFNLPGLRREIARQYSKTFTNHVREKVERDVERAKERMLAAFDSHEVTQDLEGKNSNLVDGGDLFSLIGFEKGSQPAEKLRQLLIRSVKVGRVTSIGGGVEVAILVDIPSMDEIQEETPLPWASGRSWVDEVENGVSGLGRYIVTDSPSSRSGKAVQAKSQVSNASMGGIEYMSRIIGNLVKDLTKSIK